MAERVKQHQEKYLPGTNIVLNIPIRFSISGPASFHKEIKDYFSNLKGTKCRICGHVPNRRSFGEIIRMFILKDIGVLTMDDLRNIPPYKELFKKWRQEFWTPLPFKDKSFIVSPSNYARDVWERYKKKHLLYNHVNKTLPKNKNAK